MKCYRNYYKQLSFKSRDIEYVLGSVQYNDIIYILQYKYINLFVLYKFFALFWNF